MNLRKRALAIGVGTFGAQLISAAGFVLIPKFYSPTEFGLYIIALSLATLLQPFATLKIEILSTVVSQQKDSNLLFWFVKRITVVVSFAALIVIFIISATLTPRSLTQSLVFSLTVSSIILLQSIAIIKVQERLRSDHLKKVALSGVLQNGTTLISQLILSRTSYGSLSLTLGYLVGRMVSIFALNTKSNRKEKKGRFCASLEKDKLILLLRPIWKIFPASIYDVITLALPVLFVGKFFGAESAGIVGLLQGILIVPVTLMSSMIFSTLYSQAGMLQELGLKKVQLRFRKEFHNELSKVVIMSFLTSIFLIGIVLPKILNNSWSFEFRLVVTMSIAFSLQMLNLPTLGILTIFEKFHILRNFAFLKTSSSIISCILCMILETQWIIFAISIYSVQIFFNLGFLFYSKFKMKTL
jgi:O-antigen/teichoic acid export membrane protein